ncbi:phosphomevalonate kinase [Kitasatospora sp. NPDC057692]|uniref:phosphomevalonate kinase n=1 Tax=Kitasatospora sp. NPDC057692 TaxID=3346215 RepID=UPI00367EF80B
MSGDRPPVVRSAPGKLFVAGEYAVVEPGGAAILVAVDRHLTVTAAEPAGPGVLISSDLAAAPVRWRWHGGRLDPVGAADPDRARRDLAHVVAAVEAVARLLAEHGLPEPSVDLSVSSRLHENGVKLGLGSSGAATVATVAAVAAHGGLALSAEERYRLALLASAGLDPKGSGGDLAAAAWGGWIAYRSPDRAAVLDLARRRGTAEALSAPWPGLAVRRLPPVPGLALEVGWTGTPASTAAMVSGLHRRGPRDTPAHRHYAAAAEDCVRAAAEAFDRADRPALLEQIRRARRELARLDDALGLGVFTPALTALCDAAEAVGGAAKPSGAGGGDCGIALLDTAGAHPDIDQLRERWAAAGVRPLALRPALEGNSE